MVETPNAYFPGKSDAQHYDHLVFPQLQRAAPLPLRASLTLNGFINNAHGSYAVVQSCLIKDYVSVSGVD